ncbi:sortilin-related receptor isoform X3 [Hydra vulgaris]|uniref:sortilin-related receptor isoform X3 n=1 Tax=Hydra vulgaris TaxID=6087 RepID=UPI0032E9F2DF
MKKILTMICKLIVKTAMTAELRLRIQHKALNHMQILYNLEQVSIHRALYRRTTEKKTPTRTTTFSVCSSDYFQCSNGKCIPLNWKCDDYYDCSDHSDEDPSICSRTTQITTPTKTTTFSGQITQSPTKTRTTKTETVFGRTTQITTPTRTTVFSVCLSDHFKCFSGNCIPLNWKCDNFYDCSDYSDEDPSICGRTTQITTPTRTTVFSVCSSDHFQCFSGKCIPLNWKCDDYYDCSDHSDEDPSICGRTTEITTLTRSTTFFECLSNQFQCFNGECIPLYLKCNGYYNCFDRSDEDPSICDQTTQSPPTTPTTKTATVFVCANDHFQCSNGKCILRHRKCNGVFDCSDYSDEDQYTCDQNTQSPLIAPTTRTISNFGLSSGIIALVLFGVLSFLVLIFIQFRRKKRMQPGNVQTTSETLNTVRDQVPTQVDPNNQIGVYNISYVNEPPPPYETTLQMCTPFNNHTDEPPPSYYDLHVNLR